MPLDHFITGLQKKISILVHNTLTTDSVRILKRESLEYKHFKTSKDICGFNSKQDSTLVPSLLLRAACIQVNSFFDIILPEVGNSLFYNMLGYYIDVYCMIYLYSKGLVACCHSFLFIFTLTEHTNNILFIRLVECMPLLISSLLPLGGGSPVGCRAEVETRACHTASKPTRYCLSHASPLLTLFYQ